MATTTTVVVPPDNPTVIDEITLSAAATYTSKSWSAESFRIIKAELVGTQSAFSYTRFQFNALATNIYSDVGTNTSSGGGVAFDGANFGTNGFARLGVVSPAAAGASSTRQLIEFNPRVNGAARMGKASSGSFYVVGAMADHFARSVEFACSDAATPLTFFTLSWNAATFTGRVLVEGYP